MRNKNIIKGFALCASVLGFGILSYQMSSNFVNANEDQPLAIQSPELTTQEVRRATEVNVVSRLAKTLKELKDNNETVNEEQLQVLSYYAFQYLKSADTYIIDKSELSLDPHDLILEIQELANRSELESYFSVDQDQLILTNDLHAPDNLEKVLESIENQVVKSLSKSKSKVKIDVKESDDLLEVSDVKE